MTTLSPEPQLRILPIPQCEPGVQIIDKRSLLMSVSQESLPLEVGRNRLLPVVDTTPEVDGLPDPTRTVTSLAPAVMEVLSGIRPASQLVRWTSQDVQAALARRAAVAQRVNRPGLTRLAGGRPPVVRAVQVCRPTARVAEASAVVVQADRVRALAFRLEAIEGRWRATALEVG